MREAGTVAALTKAHLRKSLAPGMTSGEVDQIAEKEIRKLGAIPSFKGLYGFPATICFSINNEIVHGIPSDERVIQTGDVVSIDLGAVVGGFHSDTAFTVNVGDVPSKTHHLIDTTEESLNQAIALCLPGNRIGDISHAVQNYAESFGYGVVRQYVGHGIGRSLHEEPQVPNYGMPGRGPMLRPGMTIAIEPMLNIGSWETELMSDGWTVVTADGSLSAHFEDTIAITEDGPEVLTLINSLVK